MRAFHEGLKILTRRPAKICQMPATRQSGDMVMQHQIPKKMAPKKIAWHKIVNFRISVFQFTSTSQYSSTFPKIPHPNRGPIVLWVTATRIQFGHEALHIDKSSIKFQLLEFILIRNWNLFNSLILINLNLLSLFLCWHSSIKGLKP